MVYIERKNIKTVWKKMFVNTESTKEVWATNCVIPSEWDSFDIVEKLGVNTQKTAINRKIKIKRVHLLDFSDANQVNGQNYIDSVLTSQLDSNFYESRFLSIDKLNAAINNKYDLRFKDIGICNVGSDNEILFITDISDNYSINGSWVTTNKEKVKEAKEFFYELWKELE